MAGLKRVSNRRDDALAQLSWQQFEAMLAGYYRQQGYEVEHCGTAGAGGRFDGGVDLKLRRADEYVLVQCKHWNAYKLPHNTVHELIGLMFNEHATGAILVNSGEYTRAAREAAGKQSRLKLIDGGDLREMLNPLLGSHSEQSSGATVVGDFPRRISNQRIPPTFGSGETGHGPGASVGHTEQRPWGSGYRRRGKSGTEWMVRLAIGVFFLLALAKCLPSNFQRSASHRAEQPRVAKVAMSPKPPKPVVRPVVQPPVDKPTTDSQSVSSPAMQYQPAIMNEAERREWERKNKEAMEIIEKTTPEL